MEHGFGAVMVATPFSAVTIAPMVMSRANLDTRNSRHSYKRIFGGSRDCEGHSSQRNGMTTRERRCRD
jgi:hypothetical protein